MESLTLVLLWRPRDAPDMPEAELDRLQEAHLAHLAALLQDGRLRAVGPVEGQPDEALRGVCLYGVGVEDALALAEGDPAVRAGRLRAEVMTWRFRRAGADPPP